jgi:hypothetical protein
VDLEPFLGVTQRSRAAAPTLPEFSREAYEALLAYFPTLDRR